MDSLTLAPFTAPATHVLIVTSRRVAAWQHKPLICVFRAVTWGALGKSSQRRTSPLPPSDRTTALPTSHAQYDSHAGALVSLGMEGYVKCCNRPLQIVKEMLISPQDRTSSRKQKLEMQQYWLFMLTIRQPPDRQT